LHYYGEEGDSLAVEAHLETCEACRLRFGSLERIFHFVDSLAVPERGPEYGAELWRTLKPRLVQPRPSRTVWLLDWLTPRPLRVAAAAAAFSVLLIAAFLAGRFYPQAPERKPVQMAVDPRAGERILLVAVGDYLERSQMMLIELKNTHTDGPLDISDAQERASDLVSESRLYRQTALRRGEAAVASVLDDLERVLLEISHAPSPLSEAQLENLRQRLEAEGILFKIRVLGSNVRNQVRPVPDSAEGSKRL
jgi:hypothetical protein